MGRLGLMSSIQIPNLKWSSLATTTSARFRRVRSPNPAEQGAEQEPPVCPTREANSAVEATLAFFSLQYVQCKCASLSLSVYPSRSVSTCLSFHPFQDVSWCCLSACVSLIAFIPLLAEPLLVTSMVRSSSYTALFVLEMAGAVQWCVLPNSSPLLSSSAEHQKRRYVVCTTH